MLVEKWLRKGHTIISSWAEFAITLAWNARNELAGEIREERASSVTGESLPLFVCLLVCCARRGGWKIPKAVRRQVAFTAVVWSLSAAVASVLQGGKGAAMRLD